MYYLDYVVKNLYIFYYLNNYVLYFKYGIDLNIYNISKSTLIAIIFVFLSFYIDQYIYIGGRDVSLI